MLRNDFAPSYISVGEKESKVTVKCRGGKIEYVSLTKGMSGKTLSVNQYEVAPLSVHPKVGKAPLSDFLPQCTDGRPQIFYNADPVTIQPSPTAPQTVVDFNYQSQFQGMFLFSMSPSQMSVVFNHLFGASRYQTALRLVNRDITALNSESERLADERRICSDTLMADESELSDIRMKLSVTDSYIEALNRLGSGIESADNAENSLRDITARKSSAYAEMAHIRKLSENVQRIRDLYMNLSKVRASVENLERHISVRRASESALDKCKPVRDRLYRLSYYINGVTAITKAVGDRNRISECAGKLRQNVSILKRMNLSEVSDKITTLYYIECLNNRAESLSDRTASIRASIEKIKCISVSGISDILSRIIGMRKLSDSMGDNISSRQRVSECVDRVRAVQKALESYRDSLVEAGGYVCPLCGERKKCRC